MNNVQSIIDRYNAGEKLDFLFFWGPGERDEDRHCLNQWSETPFIHNHFEFSTAEHAMMAEKAMKFGDWDTFNKILNCTTPWKAKDLGRQVRGYVDTVWNAERVAIVTEISYQRFKQNTELCKYLLSTKGKILVEASEYDAIWGIKMTERHKDVGDPNKWKGLNCLGEALMNARDRLEAENV